MNIENTDSSNPADIAETGDTATPAPKRRPRARKTVDAVDSTGEAAASPVPAAEDAAASGALAEPDAKPARAPRKPRVAKPKPDLTDAGAVVEASTGAVVSPMAASVEAPAMAEVKSPRRGRVEDQPAPSVVAEAKPAQSPMPVRVDAGIASGDTGPAGAQAGGGAEGAGSEDVAIGMDAGEAGEGEGRRERSRNRRRGRRGGSAGRGEGEGAETVSAGAGVPPSDGGEASSGAVPSLPAPDTTEVFASLLSGEFDTEPPVVVAEEPEGDDKRVLAPDPDAPKLHKVLAQSGIGSRRDMEQMIQDGRVSVNGETAHIGMRISFGDRIAIDGKPAKVRIAPPPPRIIAYHKPAGEVVTHDDPQQRPTVFRRLPRLPQGKWQSVGRLDINTEGLLLFTNSGDLANKLMHPRFGVEREYAVRVLGTLEKEPREQLLAGVNIDGQPAAFKSIEEGGGEGVNRWYRVVITEGRNREVRKLFDAVGLTVSRLIRVRYGCVVLPRGLKRGVWVDLNETDVKALRVLTGGAQPAPRNDGRDQRHESRGGDGRRDGGKSGPRPQQPQQGKRGGAEQRPPMERAERGDRNRPPREERRGRGASAPQGGGDSLPREFREPGDPTRIPNPLQQTFDKRAIQRERSSPREDLYENGPIPNPLQQTYDKRFVQGQRGGGFGNPNQSRGGKGGRSGDDAGQPDPMKTSVGYIGADAFTRKSQGRGNNRGGRRGGR